MLSVWNLFDAFNQSDHLLGDHLPGYYPRLKFRNRVSEGRGQDMGLAWHPGVGVRAWKGLALPKRCGAGATWRRASEQAVDQPGIADTRGEV